MVFATSHNAGAAAAGAHRTDAGGAEAMVLAAGVTAGAAAAGAHRADAGLVSSLGRIAEDGQWALDTCLSERRWLAYLSQTKSTRPGGAEAFACLYVSNAERRVFERRNNASITDAFTALPRMPAPIYCPKVLDVNSESGAALLSDALQAFPSELALVHSLAKEVLDVNSESGASLTPAALQAFPLELALVHSLAKEVIAPGCSPPSRPAGLPLGACSRAFLSQGGYGSVPPPITSTHHQVLDLDSKSGAAFLSDALQAFPSELALVRASAKETFTLPYATTATSTAGLGVVFPVLQQHPFPTSPLQQQQAQAAVVGAVTTTINLTAVVQSVLAEIFASSTPSTRDRNRTAVVQSVLAEIFSSSTPSTRDRNRTAVVQSVLAEIFSSSTPSIRDRNRTAVVQSVLAEIFSSSTPSTRDRNRTAVVQSVLAEIFSSSTPSTRDQHRTAVVQSMLAEIFSSSTPSTRDRNRTAVVQSVLAEIFSSSTPSTRDRNRTAVVQRVLAEIFSSSTPSTRSDRSVELYDTTDLAAPLMLASPMPLLFQPQPGQPVAPLLPLPPSVLRVWEMRAIVNLTLPSAGPRRYQVWCSRFTEPPSWFVEYRMPILWTLLVLALLVTQSPPVPPTVRPNRFTEPPSRFMECGMPTLFTLLVLAIVTRLPPACPFSPTCFQTRFTEPPSWYMEYVMPTLFTLLVPALVALVAVVACPQRRQFTEPPSRFEEYVPPTLFTLLVLALVALVAVVASLQRRQYEQSRRAAVEADAMRAEAEGAERSKSCFVASMTHELRTPMLGIIGMLDVLSDSHLSSNQLSDLSTARTSALKVLKLVNQVLDLSKLEAGRLQLEPGGFDVHAWVEGVVGRRWAEAQERNLHSVAAVVDADVPPQLVGDQLRLAQVLSQVMDYALSFTPHGGYVLVRVAVVDAHVPMAQLAQWNASSARVTTLIGSDDVTITGDADAAAAAAAAATACFAGSAGPGAAAGGAMQLVVTCEHSGCDNSETMNGFMFRFEINLSHTSLPFLKAVFPAATPATAPAVDAAPSAQVDGWENHGTMAMGAMVTMMLGGMGRDLSADLSGVLVVADGQPERAKLTTRVLVHLGASVLLANDEVAAARYLPAKGGLSEGADEGTETRKGAVGGGDRREQQRVGMTDGQKRADAFTTGSSEGDSEGTENSGEVGGGDRGEQQGLGMADVDGHHTPPTSIAFTTHLVILQPLVNLSFHFSLFIPWPPSHPCPADHTPTPASPAPPTFSLPSRISAVVDDAAVNLLVARRTLTRSGATVATAGSGEEALRQVKLALEDTAGAVHAHVDVVLMDLQMPLMDGFAATAAIRAHEQALLCHPASPPEATARAATADAQSCTQASVNPAIPRLLIVALTADVDAEITRRCLASGFDGVLQKPVDPKLLAQLLLRLGFPKLCAPG
ncbi:unnamed protein product [Closterium sp. NIES-64]|nr:unnamed protein product [Closterium sp. NIES-64]